MNQERFIPGGTSINGVLPLEVIGSLALISAALIAVAFGDRAQLVLAGGSILVLGLPHGASDYLVAYSNVKGPLTSRIALFIGLYLLAIMGTLLLWWWMPGPALAQFLLLSATHFAIDDLPCDATTSRPIERIVRGLAPITLPALFHHDALAGLFAALSDEAWGACLAGASRTAAPVVLVFAGVAVFHRVRAEGIGGKVGELVALMLALLVLPPLIGFSLYFALVHSRGQTAERMRQLGLKTLRAYLRATAPTMLGALLLFALLGILAWMGHAPPIGPLFVGLSALTVPHMLVTPFFNNNPAARIDQLARSICEPAFQGAPSARSMPHAVGTRKSDD